MPPGGRSGLFLCPLYLGWPCVLLWLWSGVDVILWDLSAGASWGLGASSLSLWECCYQEVNGAGLPERRAEKNPGALAASLQYQMCVQSLLGIPAPVKPPDDCGFIHDFKWGQPKSQPAEANQNHWFPESQSNKRLLYEAARFCGNRLCRKRWLVLEK